MTYLFIVYFCLLSRGPSKWNNDLQKYVHVPTFINLRTWLYLGEGKKKKKVFADIIKLRIPRQAHPGFRLISKSND